MSNRHHKHIVSAPDHPSTAKDRIAYVMERCGYADKSKFARAVGFTPQAPLACRAVIVGGGKDKPHLGVWLDMPARNGR